MPPLRYRVQPASLTTLAVVILASLTVACGGGSSSSNSGGNGGGGGGTVPNTQAITVNSGPTGNYVNGAFTSVTVCVPGSSNCQSIPGVLVDTGSSGLRILSTALALALPQQKDGGGNPVAECNQFQDGFTWGPVQTADIKMAGEQANAVPVQVIGASNFAVPQACTNTGITSEDTLQTLGANGVLGVGSFRQDCGPACAVTGSQNPGLYFSCPSSGCVATSEPIASQLQNPVWMFASDNNGVLIKLPSVPATGTTTVNGSMIFGIGTQSDNGLGNATVFKLNNQGEFTTVFNGRSVTTSFVDSGSNGIFFLTQSATGIPTCTGSANASSFYCPPSPLSLSAVNQGTNGTSNTVNFTVVDANTLFSNVTFNAFAGLAGPNPGFFDWGLPFFYGRNVFSAIESQNTPAGVGPYWAY
jgi:hypothetical protein